MVNFGHLTIEKPLISNIKRERIIIIGAGPSGVAAASQLTHFGFDVQVIEARDRVGGRVYDGLHDRVPGQPVESGKWTEKIARGAMVINGCQNNPFGILTQQLGHDMHILGSRCDLFVKSEAIPKIPDSRMEMHFNSILDILSDWRGLIDSDIDLSSAVEMAHKEYVAQSSQMFDKLELKLLEFHISNLEYACGANLSKVSALNWDQNEQFPQFQGDHTIMTHGFGATLECLSEQLKIDYNQPVKSIEIKNDSVKVISRDGTQYNGDRCLVTVPLALLKKRAIEFQPPLSLVFILITKCPSFFIWELQKNDSR